MLYRLGSLAMQLDSVLGVYIKRKMGYPAGREREREAVVKRKGERGRAGTERR